MFKVSIKGILARKSRLLLTSLAVIMATAFLSSTYIFSDTIQNTFDDLFADAFRNTDAYVRSSNVIEADFGNKQRDRHPRHRHRRGQGCPGRLRRAGRRHGLRQHHRQGRQAARLRPDGATHFGSVVAHGRPGHLELRRRRQPAGRRPGRHRHGQRRQGPLRGRRQDQDRWHQPARASSRSRASPASATPTPPAAPRSRCSTCRQRRSSWPSPASSTPCRSAATARSATRSWPAASSPPSARRPRPRSLTGAEITKENQSDIQKNLRLLHGLPERSSPSSPCSCPAS